MIGFFTEVVLPFAHLISSIITGYSLWAEGHPYWGTLTISSLFIPAILELIYVLRKVWNGRISGSEGRWLILAAIFFPFCYPIWQSYLWWKTHRHDDQWLKDNFYSKKMVLSCSQSLTEGAVQSILQVIIILDNFKNGKVEVWKMILEFVIISTGLGSVAIAISELHGHQKTAKEDVPNKAEIRRGVPYYFLTSLFRTLILAFLAMYLKGYFFIVLGLLVMCNFLLSHFILRKEQSALSKNIMTAFGSVTVPMAFISSPDLVIYNESLRATGRRLYKYHILNSVCFALITLGTTLFTFLWYVPEAVADALKLNEENPILPIVSCLPSNLPLCDDDYDWPIAVSIIVLIGIKTSLPWIQDRLSSQFFGDRFREVEPV